jgi:phosphate transport system permease protein
MSVAATDPTAPADAQVPRRLDKGLPPSDRVFHVGAFLIGALVLAITGSIGLFLGYQLKPTLHQYGWHFFTQTQWVPGTKDLGVAAALVGTVEVAGIAIVVSVPLALLTALYISEYAWRPIRGALVSLIDLMAAIPSIIYGLWGFFLFQPHVAELTRWLSAYLGWFPPFHVDTDPHAPVVPLASQYWGSLAIAGLLVAMMAMPIACAVMRGVFAQAPVGEREAALALGATHWGMIRTVVLPFGRGGIIGGSMLGLGRALGETIAILIIISPSFTISFRLLQTGFIAVAPLIASRQPESTPDQLSALLAAGFVLFVVTMLVNFLAAAFITRSRSGAATEI